MIPLSMTLSNSGPNVNATVFFENKYVKTVQDRAIVTTER